MPGNQPHVALTLRDPVGHGRNRVGARRLILGPVARRIASWLSGPPGETLGLPESGPRSLART
ncbi:MAG: hypothetical protein ACRDU0_05600, partial [Mycobacterium sp.]